MKRRTIPLGGERAVRPWGGLSIREHSHPGASGEDFSSLHPLQGGDWKSRSLAAAVKKFHAPRFSRIILPKKMLLNLAQSVTRQALDHVKRTGNFERRQAFATTLLHLGGIDRRSSDEVSHRHLASQAIWSANDRGFSHLGLLGQKVLDFTRIDVEAPRNDQIASAALQSVIAISSARGQVTRAEVLFDKGLFRGLAVSPVFTKHIRAANVKFSGLPVRNRLSI